MTRTEQNPSLRRRVALSLALAGGFVLAGSAGTPAFAQAPAGEADDRIYDGGAPPMSIAPEPRLNCGLVPAEVRTQAQEQGACDPAAVIPPGTVVKSAEMGLDCTNMTPEARAYADEHRLCDGARQLHEITPDGIAWGNCGISWIYVYPGSRGTARLTWGFWSIQGRVVRRNLVVSYYRPGHSWYFSDNGWMLSDWYQRTREVWVAAPTSVIAGLSGTVRLFWGGTCAVLHPTDSAWVPW
jgi:hypothetical protein